MSHPQRRAGALAALAIILALSLWRLAPLAQSEWYASHEGMAPVERVVALSIEMAHGDFYPRWLSAAFHGHGLPFFNFYSPAAYWLAALLHVSGLTVTAALKAVMLAAVVGGGAGMFVWLRRHAGTAGALTAGILYAGSPYLAHDLLVRGAFAEAVALGLLPWLFVAVDRCLAATDRPGMAGAAAVAAAIGLTHNLSALMIAPFALAYALWRAAGPVSRGRLPHLALAGVAAAGLSAFYWLPVVMERSALRPLGERLTEGPFHYSHHFLDLSAWMVWRNAEPGLALGPALLLGVAATLLLGLRLDRPRRHLALALLALAVAAALMTSPLAAPLYEGVPGLAFVQFPWRFLGAAGLFAAACAAFAATALPRRARGLPVAAALLLVVLADGVPAPEPTTLPGAYGDDTRVVANRMVGRLSMRDEYLPRWAAGTPARLQIVAGRADSAVSGIVSRGHRLEFDVRLPAPDTLELPFHYFPGWQVRRGADALALGASPRGFIALALPAGMHHVTVEFASTPARRAAWAISAATLGLLIGLPWASRRRMKPAARRDANAG